MTPDYDGGDLVLGNSGLILSPDTFPHLASLKGRTLITSDGTTILGADDKAGIAEILTMIEYITANNIEHPAIKITMFIKLNITKSKLSHLVFKKPSQLKLTLRRR